MDGGGGLKRLMYMGGMRTVLGYMMACVGVE